MWIWIASAIAVAASLGAMARAARVSALEDALTRACARLKALEHGLACGPEAERFDGIRALADRVTTLGIQLGKLTPLGAHSDLCERVAHLDRGLQSLADRHAEFAAATAESIDAIKGRIVVAEDAARGHGRSLANLSMRLVPLMRFQAALVDAAEAEKVPEDDPE